MNGSFMPDPDISGIRRKLRVNLTALAANLPTPKTEQ